jgi:hypothetical protein
MLFALIPGSTADSMNITAKKEELSNVTRADAVIELYRMAGSPAVKYESYYADVPGGQPFTNAAMWAHNANLVPGYENGYFFPNNDITREELATMLLRFADIKYPTAGDMSAFEDVGNISAYALEAMSWCVARGLLNGATANVLEPEGNITQIQFAAVLRNFVGLKEDPRNIWVLNPKPSKPPVNTVGLAPRVTGGWGGKTVVVLSNYNGAISNPLGALIEGKINATLPAGSSVRYIYVGDMTVISGQTVTPSRAPNSNWETFGYESFLAGVKNGSIKPDAVINGVGF